MLPGWLEPERDPAPVQQDQQGFAVGAVEAAHLLGFGDLDSDGRDLVAVVVVGRPPHRSGDVGDEFGVAAVRQRVRRRRHLGVTDMLVGQRVQGGPGDRARPRRELFLAEQADHPVGHPPHRS